MISMSCRAAWKTFTTPGLAISSKKGLRSRPFASGSTSTSSVGLAIWIRQSCGQKVVSRRNSVSMVMKSDWASLVQASSRAAVVSIIRCGHNMVGSKGTGLSFSFRPNMSI